MPSEKERLVEVTVVARSEVPVAEVKVRKVMVELFTNSWELEAMPVIVRFVPVAEVKVRSPIVEEGVRNSEEEARPPERIEKTGLVPTTLKRDAEREVEVPMVTLDEETRNFVLDPICRLMKSPKATLVVEVP